MVCSSRVYPGLFRPGYAALKTDSSHVATSCQRRLLSTLSVSHVNTRHDERYAQRVGGAALTTELQQTSAAQSNLGPSEAPSRAATPPDVSIRPASPQDAAAIADIGARVFDATFAHTCSQEDMDTYLADNFTPAVITAELADPAKSFYVACVGAKVAAFLALNKDSTEPCIEHIPAQERIEVQRLYADPDVQGRGVARLLMEAAMRIVREQGYRYAWLGVWENNVRATKFYEKFGFGRVGEHEFWLGNDCQLDYIFGREL